MNLTLSELTNRLQDLCYEGLSKIKVTVEGKEDIEIQYDPNYISIDIRRAHK